jgi:hypothetical protein
VQWLLLAEIAINLWDAVSIGVSPFFLSHRFHSCLGDGINITRLVDEPVKSLQERGEQIIQKLQLAIELIQAYIADAQQ